MTQLQLDVWGEVLDGLSLTRNALLHDPDDSWDVQTALMDHLESALNQPDNGVWEMRGPRRHFTHSTRRPRSPHDRDPRTLLGRTRRPPHQLVKDYLGGFLSYF